MMKPNRVTISSIGNVWWYPVHDIYQYLGHAFATHYHFIPQVQYVLDLVEDTNETVSLTARPPPWPRPRLLPCSRPCPLAGSGSEVTWGAPASYTSEAGSADSISPWSDGSVMWSCSSSETWYTSFGALGRTISNSVTSICGPMSVHSTTKLRPVALIQ